MKDYYIDSKNRKVTILNKTGFDEYEKFKKLPYESQVFLYNTGKIEKGCGKHEIVEDKEKIFLSNRRYSISVGKNHYYLKQTEYSGLTYTKSGRATQRVKIWKGNYCPQTQFIESLLEYTGNEWWNEFDHLGKELLTPGLLGMILKGSITNPKDYCKYYIKNCLRLDVSPKLFYDCLRYDPCNMGYGGLLCQEFKGKGDFVRIAMIATNPDNFLKLIASFGTPSVPLSREDSDYSGWKHDRHFDDMVYQAVCLNKKINFNWSKRRFHEVHQEWTDLMLQKELEFIPETKYEYKGKLDIPEEWKLISSSKELYQEGMLMHHCIYGRDKTIDKKECFIIHGLIGNDELTIAVRCVRRRKIKGWGIDDLVWEATEIQGKCNSEPTNTARDIISKCVDLPENQKFFSDNSPSNKEDIEEEVEIEEDYDPRDDDEDYDYWDYLPDHPEY